MKPAIPPAPGGAVPFRALCGAEAWPLSELPRVLGEMEARGLPPRRAEAWVVFEDDTYGVFILHTGGERLTYAWEPPDGGPAHHDDSPGCIEFARRVARDPRILPEMRDRIRFAIFTGEDHP